MTNSERITYISNLSNETLYKMYEEIVKYYNNGEINKHSNTYMLHKKLFTCYDVSYYNTTCMLLGEMARRWYNNNTPLIKGE